MKADERVDMAIEEFVGHAKSLLQEIEKAVVGKRDVLEHLLAAFLSNGGHILIEDYPGLAKTLIANAFADVLGLTFRRIQFTPDLLPGDITGGYIFDTSLNQFGLRKGPIFTNILLADEINRASPKTQSALLEAMQEYQVTLEGETLDLPFPFIVVATQNPIEYEGTFPLPEAQLDRFIVRLDVGYPGAEEELEILERRRQRKDDAIQLNAVVSADVFSMMRQIVEEVYVDPDVERYIVALVSETRIHPQIAVGSSPRGSLALLKLSRAWAALQGRMFVTPDDVKQFAREALCHRLILEPSLWGSRTTEQDVVDEILGSVAVPVIPDHDH
jgi:MoxR-like ATPase